MTRALQPLLPPCSTQGGCFVACAAALTDEKRAEMKRHLSSINLTSSVNATAVRLRRVELERDRKRRAADKTARQAKKRGSAKHQPAPPIFPPKHSGATPDSVPVHGPRPAPSPIAHPLPQTAGGWLPSPTLSAEHVGPEAEVLFDHLEQYFDPLSPAAVARVARARQRAELKASEAKRLADSRSAAAVSPLFVTPEGCGCIDALAREIHTVCTRRILQGGVCVSRLRPKRGDSSYRSWSRTRRRCR
jgi:hypothetical protein